MFGITNRIILFFSLFLVLLSIFFCIGSAQNYLDVTLRLIAIVIQILSIASFIFVLYGIILLIYKSITFKVTRKTPIIVLYVFALLIALLCGFVSSLIIFLQF